MILVSLNVASPLLVIVQTILAACYNDSHETLLVTRVKNSRLREPVVPKPMDVTQMKVTRVFLRVAG